MSKIRFFIPLCLLLTWLPLAAADDYVVNELRKGEIRYFGVEGEPAGTLSRASLSGHFGDIAVIGYDPELMMAQLIVPGQQGEDIFVMANDIVVSPQQEWHHLTMASASMETVCLAERRRKSLPGRDESTHAAHALFSCR